MSESKTEEFSNMSHINWQDVLDISRSEEMRSELEVVLSEGKPCQIDLSEVTKVDTAAMQVLASFAKDAQTKGIELHWNGTCPAFDDAKSLLGMSDLFPS